MPRLRQSVNGRHFNDAEQGLGFGFASSNNDNKGHSGSGSSQHILENSHYKDEDQLSKHSKHGSYREMFLVVLLFMSVGTMINMSYMHRPTPAAGHIGEQTIKQGEGEAAAARRSGNIAILHTVEQQAFLRMAREEYDKQRDNLNINLERPQQQQEAERHLAEQETRGEWKNDGGGGISSKKNGEEDVKQALGENRKLEVERQRIMSENLRIEAEKQLPLEEKQKAEEDKVKVEQEKRSLEERLKSLEEQMALAAAAAKAIRTTTDQQDRSQQQQKQQQEAHKPVKEENTKADQQKRPERRSQGGGTEARHENEKKQKSPESKSATKGTADHSSSVALDLPSSFVSRMVLWLKADEGVETGRQGEVERWRDRSGKGNDFVQLAVEFMTAGYKKLQDEMLDFVADFGNGTVHEGLEKRVSAARRTGGAPTLDSTGHVPFGESVALSRYRLPLVHFPCSLVCSSAGGGGGLTLHDGMTLFFVLSPTMLAEGDHAPGQRFFGTYPQGQFRFADGKPGVRLKLDYTHPHTGLSVQGGRYPTEKEGVLRVVAYRLDQKVEIAYDSAQGWTDAVSASGRIAPAAVFSSQVPVVLGGSQANSCGFFGEIGEVIVFDAALSDIEAQTVLNYLGSKWTLPAWLRQQEGEEGEGKSMLAMKTGFEEVGEGQGAADDAGVGNRLEGGGDKVTDLQLRRAIKLPQLEDKESTPGKASEKVVLRGGDNRKGNDLGKSAEKGEASLKHLKQQQKEEEKEEIMDPHHKRQKKPSLSRLRDQEQKSSKGEGGVREGSGRGGTGGGHESDNAPLVMGRGRGAAGPAVAEEVGVEGRRKAEGRQGNIIGGGGGGGAAAKGGGGCDFSGTRVENWEPPFSADVRSKYQWSDTRKAAMDKIKKFNRGGQELRDLIHKEVVALDILRHDLFCR